MKILVLTLFLFITAPLLIAQSLNDSLLIYYPLDGNANDSSGNQFNGIPYTSFAEDRFGNPESACYFDGFDDFIAIPESNALKPPLPLSFSFWVKVESLSRDSTRFFCNDYYDENNYYGCWMMLSADGQGKVGLHFGSGEGGTGYQYRRSKLSEDKLQKDTWHFVVGVIRDSTDMDIYIDYNNAGGTYSGMGGELAYANNPAILGRGSVIEPVQHFRGAMDDFRYWNRALTQQDVDSLRSVGVNEIITEHKDCIVYPNPSKGEFTFASKHDYAETHILKVYDARGRIVMEKRFNKQEFSFAIERKGIYFYRIESDSELLCSGRLIIPSTE